MITNVVTIAIIGGLIGMLGFGISDFLAKKAIDKIGDLKTLFYAQIIGAIFILPILLRDGSLPPLTSTNILYIFLFGLANLISYILLYRAFSLGKISVISPISSSYAVLTAVTSFLFFGEAMSGTKIFFLLLVLAGVFLTSVDFRKLRDGVSAGDFSKGIPEILVFFVIVGLYIPFWNRFLNTEGWIFWVFMVRIILSSLLLIYMLFIKKVGIGVRGKPLILLLIFVALFEAVASFGSSWGFHNSVNATSIVASVSSAYPLITVLLGFIFLKERLALNQYIGIAVIIAGLSISPFL
jgi:uncharacterized membrane protein